MVNDRVLVKLQGRYYSNTSSLGQVLMATMLKEVSEFCKINIQQSWATQAHQQVCDRVICTSIVSIIVNTLFVLIKLHIAIWLAGKVFYVY